VSSVTDLVMVIPFEYMPPGSKYQKYADQFEDVFEQMQGWRPREITDSPASPKGWMSNVYVAGVNYLNWDISEAMEKLDWPPGTTLYLCYEDGSPMVLQLGKGDE
jgi:hypothetical protein